MKRVVFRCDAPGCASRVEALPRDELEQVPLPAGWLRIDATYRSSGVGGTPGARHGQRSVDEVCSLQCAVRRTTQLLAVMDNINDAPPVSTIEAA